MTEQVNKTSAVVALDEPVVRGETEITSVTVRKPKSGALRGVRLVALMDMDVTAMTEVLPRITDPALTKPEIMAMSPGDLLNMSIEVVNFLLPKSMQTDYRND
ncbi:phage tail assembly protein [Morganella morganii subsp. morganii]|uniref:phage tail assembly protein n=1 Tax=Morganella morganii TaxID=582 RepID=UPI0006625B63|nr:phage tail assembly protein [Morganella morganii]MBT0437092.1 phage tail assembly protein [Morganella morganii subsp. morganii]MBT0474317.1 phage tail assembly protein [Morganella morganii subsp. morganii]MBT0503121.1 phage tail assembly protein [Morganella morganii subsp. morganii]MCW3200413.1 phage tail assembly protein [Morganella morganii]PCP71261.1 phage tail assembly protein [Morganella morganii]